MAKENALMTGVRIETKNKHAIKNNEVTMKAYWMILAKVNPLGILIGSTLH